jgi:hypothetical protein
MKGPQNLCGASAGEAKPARQLIAADGRKFPLEVLRWIAIKSVTGVTPSRPILFMISIIKSCFLRHFSHSRLKIHD